MADRYLKTKKGFTLVELLVVISIIAILMAVLMPSLRKARQQAQLIVCRNNIKQIVVGMNTYAATWKKYPERVTDADPHKVWWDKDDKYSKDFWYMYKDYVCGSFEKADFSFCPLRDRNTSAGALNPRNAKSNPTEEDIAASKYVDVSDAGYKIGYSIFAGIKEPPGQTWFRWDHSGNSVTDGPPKIAGSSKDAIVTDFVQNRLKNWYNPHAPKKAPDGYDPEGGLYLWDPDLKRIDVTSMPPGAGSITVGFGDGHIVVRKNSENYVNLVPANKDRRWFYY